MFKKIIEFLKQVVKSMHKSTENGVVKFEDVTTTSDVMIRAIDKWKNMYADNAEWLDEEDGVYSLGVPASICSELSMYILNEMSSHIVVPGEKENGKSLDSSSVNVDSNKNRASYLDDIYHKHLLNKIDDVLEQAMALGGVIIKPYISNNTVYFDFCYQGEFYPIAFDDDGNITDVAFLDQFILDENKYTKVERQTFKDGTVTIINKAYVTKYNSNTDSNELGKEIPLTSVDKWANITPEVPINNVERPLYGFYKVPLANNIDVKSPLGISVFSRATGVIERTDHQYSRLDWEYEGGQMAIDVDPTAIVTEETYFGTKLKQDEKKNRIYRRIDLGTDETYNAFTPALRDGNYIAGLNRYLMRIEDIVGLARGALSEVSAEARTATEIRVLKQRTFNMVHKHQQSLQVALESAIYAMNVLVELYKEELKAPNGEYVTNTEWSDSVLVDIYTELDQRLRLVDADILSKTEVRMWYTGEDEATAAAKIDEIQSNKMSNMLPDIFSSIPQTTIESNTDEE